MKTDAAWFARAVDALLASQGRLQSGKLGWTIFHGHRAVVLVPCDELGPLGVIRKWQSQSVAQHELGMLQSLVSAEPASVVATLPRHVASLSHGRAVLSAQTWLSGAPLSSAIRGQGSAVLPRIVAAVADWFAARLAARAPTVAFPNFLTDEILARLGRRTPGGAAELALVRFIDQAAGLEAECGVLHNDLHLGNLLFDQLGALSGVLDWEHAGPGPLLCDWFGFVNEYALWQLGERGGVGPTVRALNLAWQTSSPLSQAVLAHTRRLSAGARARPAAIDACFRLAAFRFSYARIHDESPAAQAAVAQSLDQRLPRL